MSKGQSHDLNLGNLALESGSQQLLHAGLKISFSLCATWVPIQALASSELQNLGLYQILVIRAKVNL